MLRFLQPERIIAMLFTLPPPLAGRFMESARDYTPYRSDVASTPRRERHDSSGRRVDVVVLQVDSTVSAIHGLAWLIERRDPSVLTRLSELQTEAREKGWTSTDVARARLSVLRPRREEINALGQAYLGAMLPGAAEAAHRLRRAGISVALASEVAAEALFGVANALGVGPSDIQAPHLRFDALGAYVSSSSPARLAEDEGDTADYGASEQATRTLFVGTRPPELLTQTERDSFVAFTGVVAREGGASDAHETIGSFAELPELVLSA
jgi:phosphoserine phosphatase